MQEIVKCGIRFGNLDMTLVFGKEYDLLLEHCHDARVVCFSDNARDGTLSQIEMAAQLWDTFCQLGHDLIWKSSWSSVMMLEWRVSPYIYVGSTANSRQMCDGEEPFRTE